MLILTAVSLAVLVMRLLYKSWSHSMPLDPYLTFLIPSLVILVVPALVVEGSDLDWVAITGIWTVCVIALLNPRSFRTPFKFNSRMSAKTAGLLLNTLGVLHFILTCLPALEAIATHGVSGVFQRDRLADYFDGGMTSAGVVGSLRLISEMAFYVMLGTIFYKRHYVVFVCLVFGYLGALSVYANTRLSLVLPLIAVGCFYCYVRRLRSAAILSLLVSALVFLPWYIFMTNAIRHGIEPTAEIGSVVADVALKEIDYNKYLRHATEHTRVNDFEYGYGWFIGSFGNVVPRFIWQDKPVTSTSNRFTTLVTHEEPSLLNPVMTFTIYGEGYLQFGLVGVVLETVFALFIFSKLFHSYMRAPRGGGVLAAFNLLTMSLIYFRAEIPFIQIIFATLTLWILNSSLVSPARTGRNVLLVRA
jgi:hypothetical protein